MCVLAGNASLDSAGLNTGGIFLFNKTSFLCYPIGEFRGGSD